MQDSYAWPMQTYAATCRPLRRPYATMLPNSTIVCDMLHRYVCPTPSPEEVNATLVDAENELCGQQADGVLDALHRKED